LPISRIFRHAEPPRRAAAAADAEIRHDTPPAGQITPSQPLSLLFSQIYYG